MKPDSPSGPPRKASRTVKVLRSFDDPDILKQEPDERVLPLLKATMADVEERSTTEQEALRIVNTHMAWSVGAGLIPSPAVDLAAITGVS